MTNLTDPLPPLPQHTPPVDEKPGAMKRFHQAWMAWFLQARDKINIINESLISLGLLSDIGFLSKQADGSWLARTIEGTTNRITVTNGDGTAGNPIIDFANEGIQDLIGAMIVAGTNVTVTYDDTAGTITIASSGGGGGGSGRTLLGSSTVAGAAATSITVSGLDLGTDENWFIEINIKNNTAGLISLAATLNGDSTAANYRSTLTVATSSANAVTGGANANIADVDANETFVGETIYYKDLNSNPKCYGRGSRSSGTNLRICSWTQRYGVTTNPTSFTLTSSVASGFAIGSFIKVYKQ